MNLTKTIIIVFTACLFFNGCHEFGHCQSSHGESEKQEPAPVISIDKPYEFGKRILAITGDASDEELAQLVDNAEPSIALAAEWERLIRSIPSQSLEFKYVVLKESATKPFLDLVKQKIGINPPYKWRKIVQLAEWYAPVPNQLPVDFNVRAILDTKPVQPSITHDGRQTVVQQGDNTWLIPEDKGVGVAKRAAVGIQDKTAYVAVYSGSAPNPYHLYALEEGTVVWSSRVFAECNRLNYNGICFHFVEIVTTQNQVILFGLGGAAAYLEAFDAKTGDPICRFSTLNLWKNAN